MSDKKHIDRLFQEGFKDFEAAPSDAVWENIEAKLNQKEKKRRVIPIWWRYAGVAALLLLLLTVGGIYFDNTDSAQPTNKIVNTEDTTLPINSESEKDNPNNLDNIEKDNAIAKTDSSDDNKNEGLDNIATQKDLLSNQIITSKEASVAETPATLGNDSKIENSLSNSSSNKKQHAAANKLLDTEESSHTVANNLKEKNNSNGMVDDSKKNAVIADNPKEKRYVNPLQNTTAIASNIDSENKNHDNGIQKNKESLIDKEQAKKIIGDASENNHAIAKTEARNTDTAISDDSKKNSLTIEEAIDKTKDIIEEDDNVNRWSISPNAAPVYFNTLGKGSSIDPQLNSNSKSGELNMSYGISASYAINKKLSIRSGINKVNLGYNTNNIVSFQVVGVSSSSRSFQNVNSVKTSNVSNTEASSDNVFISGESLNANEIPEAFSTSNSSINQDLGYIEVPLEIEYALSDKKLGVNLIGGFSSFFLSNNRIFSDSQEGGRTFLGEANNINKISYSANLGLGLNYKVSKKIDLNLEPMFKYQINTFNNTSGDFKPYFIGVYTGFAIKF
ncbi:hypothetical protein Q4Q39_18150 [Flavivirga amylovorans]|uniref:Outer membrane protein beta-barrel domain-containing protein n=1 Tax=Flavivirga amylovorans TaxID=870486 RepID=A0ABT8X608_9FLAO|nr:hypothetical protein [Flavivirga amylovorans]MDO5989331.1 hypothetical protein [Flavivirga amylovorans]